MDRGLSTYVATQQSTYHLATYVVNPGTLSSTILP